MGRPDTRKDDIEMLSQRIGWSNKPSRLLMWLLKKLQNNEPMPPVDKKVQPGSYLDRMAQLKRERDCNSGRYRDGNPRRDCDRGGHDRSGGRHNTTQGHQCAQRNDRHDSRDRGERYARDRDRGGPMTILKRRSERQDSRDRTHCGRYERRDRKEDYRDERAGREQKTRSVDCCGIATLGVMELSELILLLMWVY